VLPVEGDDEYTISVTGGAADNDLSAYVIYAYSACAMSLKTIKRVGSSTPFTLPAVGKVVKEAHLVTSGEMGGNEWPSGFWDRMGEHYALGSYEMNHTEPWAPCCEPSNEYGQGSTSRPPASAEEWYICMRWASGNSNVKKGERYIVLNPRTGNAVVAAAGYENGPGDLTMLGGACEEVHSYLESGGHKSLLVFGVAANQGLAYGPINCN